MTKEELKQEAEEYVYKALGFDKDYIKQELNRKYNPIEPWEKSEPIDPIINETLEAYLAGAEPREKKIAELEQQIEKMKCCLNCDFIFWDGNCYYGKECKNKDHWKLRR